MNIVNRSFLSNWVDTIQVPQIINNLTYEYYESNNPFRFKIEDDQQNENSTNQIINATTIAGAELFSVFTNPYYLTHKIVQIPSLYRSVVDVYKKYSSSQDDEDV